MQIENEIAKLNQEQKEQNKRLKNLENETETMKKSIHLLETKILQQLHKIELDMTQKKLNTLAKIIFLVVGALLPFIISLIVVLIQGGD